MKIYPNQTIYRKILITLNQTDGYFCAEFHKFFYTKGVGFTKFETIEEVKSKIDEMLLEYSYKTPKIIDDIKESYNKKKNPNEEE